MTKKYFYKKMDSYGPASTQTLLDGLNFSSDIGFEPVKLGNNIYKVILSLIQNYFNTDVVLSLYPYIHNPLKNNFHRKLENICLRLFLKNKKFILYVVDLPILQSLAVNNYNQVDPTSYILENKLFKSADVICVFNEAMRDAIQKNIDIPNDKFELFEILDYGFEDINNKEVNFNSPYRIALIGNLDKNIHSSQFANLPRCDSIIYEFFGQNGEWISDFERSDFVYNGFLSQTDLMKRMSENIQFGLILRDLNNEKLVDYYNLTSTSKFSAYMVSGTPILCPSDFVYISKLVRDYEIGQSFNNINEIPNLVLNLMNNNKYKQITENSISLGEKIQNGFFLKRSVDSYLRKIS